MSKKGTRKGRNTIKGFIKTKSFRDWFISSAILLAMLLAAVIVLTSVQSVYNSICKVAGGPRRVLVSGNPLQYIRYEADVSSKEEAGLVGGALNRRICEEGIVLLKNNGALPVTANSRITLFGKNSVNMVTGGSGSSESDAIPAVNLYEGFAAAGFLCNPVMKNFYESSASGGGRPEQPGVGSVLTGFPTGEAPVSSYTAQALDSMGDYPDAAVVVITRIAGEGFDLPRTMFWNGKSYDDPEWSGTQVIPGAEGTGSHYLELDQNEKDMIELACDNFDKVIVLINSASPIEAGFLMDDGIDAALWIGFPGSDGAAAVGRILAGYISPSGRLPDTYAADFTQDPTWNNFSNNLRADGNRYTTAGADGIISRNAWFVEYREGIYSGYRYWETRGYDEAAYGNDGWYEENVVYPFGYGLSYTTFNWHIGDFRADGERIEADVTVTNTGDCAGKDVVQLYFTPPYTKGGIEKAHVVLGDFAKTELLEPGQSCTVTLGLDVRDMASYDYSDANKNGFTGYELEKGDYVIRIMRNAHDEEWSQTLTLGERRYPTDDETGAEIGNLFEECNRHNAGKWEYLSRADWEGTWPQPVTDEYRLVSEDFISGLTYELSDDPSDPWYAHSAPSQSAEELNYNQTSIKLYDLIGVSVDDPRWDTLASYLTMEQLLTLVCGDDYGTIGIDSIDKPKTIEADGPAGFVGSVSNSEIYGGCSYACQCLMGATWNKELAREFGRAIGDEALYGDARGDGTPYSGWYAPAANIHRSPFGGRNFEYYSEDAFLSGSMAAQTVKGAAEKGVTAYIKHFALNDQETNRDNTGLVTWANEQTMREIYFKPFEMAVKHGGARGVMSSFNRIGREWAGGSYALLTRLLRDEWGFEGAVITDYNAKAYMNTDQMIRAGGDLSLGPGVKIPQDITSPTALANLRRAAKNALYATANGNALNGAGPGVKYRYAMPWWEIWLIVAYVMVFLLCIGYVIYAYYDYVKKLNAKKPDERRNT